MQVSTTTINSPVGSIEVTGSAKGITSISFLDDKSNENEGPVPETLQECVKQLQEYFEKKRTSFDLPLDLKGTDFQKTVWQALLTIPFGKTTSYSAVATQINNLPAIRAVGAANGQNKLAIIIPCHRVIGSDGQLTGYAGGLWRKKWLLEFEQKTKQMGLF